MKRPALQNKRIGVFNNFIMKGFCKEFQEWLFEPKTFSGLSRNGPQAELMTKLFFLEVQSLFVHKQLSVRLL